MSAVDQALHAEAHRLKAEHRWGARKIGRALGITRYQATLLLAQPLPEGAGGRDPRLDAVVGAIVGTVPFGVEADTRVTVEHHYVKGGRHTHDTWSGRPDGLAERILDALDQAPAGPLADVPRLVIELRGPVDEDTVRRLTAVLPAAVRLADGLSGAAR